jgi:hypothetical protein
MPSAGQNTDVTTVSRVRLRSVHCLGLLVHIRTMSQAGINSLRSQYTWLHFGKKWSVKAPFYNLMGLLWK